MQTVFANIALIDDRLEKLGNILSDKLPKLDVLDTMNKKLDNFESKDSIASPNCFVAL
jgi:hypothetical protein